MLLFYLRLELFFSSLLCGSWCCGFNIFFLGQEEGAEGGNFFDRVCAALMVKKLTPRYFAANAEGLCVAPFTAGWVKVVAMRKSAEGGFRCTVAIVRAGFR